jgi:lycopene cyclase domain-containing protein
MNAHAYLLEDIGALVAVALIDRVSGLRLLQRQRFLLLLLVLNLATVIADGYLCARGVLMYSNHLLTLPRLWRMPLEDLGYGTALFVLAVETWEMLGRADPTRG